MTRPVAIIGAGLLLALPAAAGEPTPLQVLALQGHDSAPLGSAFLVQDWPEPGQRALVTALHVLADCSSGSCTRLCDKVQLTTFACYGDSKLAAGTIQDQATVMYWPKLDVAAVLLPSTFVVPPSVHLAAAPDLEVAGSGIGRNRKLLFLGDSAESPCGAISARPLGEATAGQLFGNFERHGLVVQSGTFAPDGRLLLYEARTTEGSSGGAVLLDEGGHNVLAVHNGGAHYGMGWAVRLSAVAAENATRSKLGGTVVGFTPADFRQSFESAGARDSLAVLEDEEGRLLGMRTFETMIFSGSITFGPERRDQRGPGTLIDVGGAISLPVLPWPSETLAHALGVRVGGHLRWGKYESQFAAPTGLVMNDGPAHHTDGLLEAGLELRLWRMNRLRVALSAGALVGGTLGWLPGSPARSDWLFGIPVRLRVGLAPRGFDYHAIAFEAVVTPAWEPSRREVYSGLRAATSYDALAYGTQFSWGVAYEY